MKYSVIALVASASASDIESEHMPAFLKFIGDHSKSYATKSEFEFRFAIFSKKVAEHKVWNEDKNNTSTVGVNFLTDSTDEEYKAMLGYKQSTDLTEKTVEQFDEAVLADGPIDWRSKGGVTHVKNQGQCGSCWSFSTTGALEGAHFNASGNLVSLSETQLMNCSKKNSGCNGGLMDLAFQYAETNPIMPDSEWPYVAHTTPFSCWEKYRKSKGIVTVKTYRDVPKNDPAQMKAALAQGPVSVAIEADHAAFQSYTGGVLSGSACGTQLDHGVLAVGWGTDSSGVDYIIVKNSWGPNWGLSGYIQLASASGAGTCGINQSASIPTTN